MILNISSTFRSILILGLCLGFNAYGQDTLSLSDAIRLALENNHDIRIAELNSRTAALNAHPGNAGLLPNISVDGSGTYSLSDANVELTNAEQGPGQPSTISTSVNGIQTYAASLGLGVNYVVFDGNASRNNYRILQANARLSNEQTRSILERQIYQVASAYYQLARLYGSQAIQKEALSISKERLGRLQNQWEFGSTTKLQLLNAEVDLNTDSVNLATSSLNIDNARRNLSLLIGREGAEPYSVERAVAYDQQLTAAGLTEQALQTNADLKVANYNKQVADLNLKVAQAARVPQLSVNGSYGYNYQNNGPVSFLQVLRSWGFNGGASLSIPVFTGNRVKKNIEVAKVGINSATIAYDQVHEQLIRDIENAYQTYQNSILILKLEQKSLEAAKANFERTQESYTLGQSTGTQFREAQLNLLRIQNRINDLQYDAKLNELELYRISGTLLQEE